MATKPPETLPEQPRLLNVYKLGADPEFVCEDTRTGQRIDADALALKTGLAYGADMNGRLVELRPRPSRFALEVVASILKEVRCMSAYCVHARPLAWRCGAFVHKDGLGGHVHVGRKIRYQEIRKWAKWFKYQENARRKGYRFVMEEPQLPEVIKALDLVNEILTDLGVFPKVEVKLRRGGDQHNQLYGQPSDIRVQAHGYEYRTYPSWMDSPWAAYLVLTLTKLVVYDPEILPKPNADVFVTAGWRWKDQRLRHLLAFYKGLDDDAAIAYEVLRTHGWPKFVGGDFKPRWGIDPTFALRVPEIIPTDMEPTREEVEELFNHFLKGTPLAGRPIVNWRDRLPENYHSVVARTRTKGFKGLGEILTGIAGTDNLPMAIGVSEGEEWVMDKAFTACLPKDWQARLVQLGVPVRVCRSEWSLCIGASWREPGMVKQAHKVLTSGVFPLWEADSVDTKSFALWEPKQEKGQIKLRGKVLFQEGI